MQEKINMDYPQKTNKHLEEICPALEAKLSSLLPDLQTMEWGVMHIPYADEDFDHSSEISLSFYPKGSRKNDTYLFDDQQRELIKKGDSIAEIVAQVAGEFNLNVEIDHERGGIPPHQFYVFTQKQS
ncbi:MAG: hypothetical protein RL557_1054 [archaeon]|jgi:hypothetical protein